MRDRRGIALIIVLMLSGLMALLAVAFVLVNRHQMQLTGDTLARQNALDACVSGMAFVRSQIEQDSNWGSKAFAAGAESTAYTDALNVTVYGDGVDDGGVDGKPNIANNYVEGLVRTPGGVEHSFTARVVNNLNSSTALTNSDTSKLQLGEVPPKSVKIRIEGRAGPVTRRLDLIFRKKAFTDASVATNRELVVDAGSTPKRGWTITSRDETNLVRANGNVTAPDPTSDNLLRFSNVKGSIKGGEEITLKNLALSDPTSAAAKAAAEARAGGTFRPHSPKVKIRDLRGDQLQLPARKIDNVAPGDYTFLTAEYVSYQPDPSGPGTIKVSEYCRALKLPDGRIFASRLAPVIAPSSIDPPDLVPSDGGSTGWRSIDGVKPIDSETGLIPLGQTNDDKAPLVMAADLASGQIGIPPGATINVQGNLSFVGAEDFRLRGYVPTSTASNFTVLMGTEVSAVPGAGGIVTGGVSLDYNSPGQSFSQYGTEGGALNVTGNLNIGGTLTGLGGVSSDGKVEFSAQPGLNTTKNLGVAVRAEGGLKVEPPPKTRQLNMLANDGMAFANAVDGLSSNDQKALDDKAPGDIPSGLMNRLMDQKVDMTGAQVIGLLKPELEARGAVVNADFNGPLADWRNRSLNLTEYLQLREFLKLSWNLEAAKTALKMDTRPLAQSQIATYQLFAQTNQMLFSEFMATGAEIPDMMFRGLVYAGGAIEVLGGNNSFLSEGSLVSQGNITVQDVPSFISIYNRDYLDNVLSSSAGGPVQLESTYFGLH